VNPDGSEKWNFRVGTTIGSSPALTDDGTLYITSHRSLASLNVDGTFNWYYTPTSGNGGVILNSTPTVGPDGTIYYGCVDGYLHAVNPDGSKKWQFQAGSNIQSSPALGPDGAIYFGSLDTFFYALDANGNEKWKFSSGGEIHSSPVIGMNGVIFFGSADGYVYALNADGTERWKYQTENNVNSSPAISAKGAIIIGSDDHNLYSIGYAEQGAGETPEVDIYANKATYSADDQVTISVKVDNGSGQDIDLYAAVFYQGALYLYPDWSGALSSEHIINISASSVWDNTILTVPFFIKAQGTYTFYAGIAEKGTLNFLGFDSVTIVIE
jgi:outer membrane protein assembly factor BamB